MAGPATPERTSLERLKALDNLPTLEEQLHEANRLCSHPARAEMISRWLLGKLKSSGEARNKSTSWTLLTQCVRVLSKQRIAVLLATNGFVDTLHSTCKDPALPKETLIELGHLLSLLLELAQDASGAAVKSVLSLTSVIAASVCGSCLQLVFECCATADNLHAEQWILEPVIQLWALRKRNDSDDELFNRNCLVPVSLLLVTLPKCEALPLNERKRGNDGESSSNRSVITLDSLIAKHTILPARAVFFQSQTTTAKQPHDQIAPASQPQIRERLGPLKMALLGRQSPEALKALPAIMDIALRSVPLPTPKHRLNEQPWIQTLMATLRSYSVNQERHDENAMLTAMLQSIHCRGLSLSLQVLLEIVEQNALSQDQERDVDWALLAKVVQLDTDVFASNQTLVERIFDAITIQQTADASIVPSKEEERVPAALLKNEIVLPIMRSFARSRLLITFKDTWHKQLLQLSCVSDNNSIWPDVGGAFSDILEEALTYDQIVDLIDRLSQTIEACVTSAETEHQADWGKCSASLVQLQAIINGIRTEELLARLLSRLEKLIQYMSNLKSFCPNRSAHIVLRHWWQLLAVAFELWFPLWAAQQSDKAAVAQLGVSLFESQLYTAAREPSGRLDDSTARAAQGLIATLCNCFRQYHDHELCTRLVVNGLDHFDRLSNRSALDTFLKYPALLAMLDSARRQRVLGCLFETSATSDIGSDHLIDGTVAAVLSLGDRSVFDDALAIAVEQLERTSRSQNCADGSTESSSLRVFLSIDHATLKQEQRTAILDAISQFGAISPGKREQRHLQTRFSLLSTLLPSARYDVKLLQDASNIFNLAALADAEGSSSVFMEKSPLHEENIHLFAKLVKTLLDMWVVHKNEQQRDKFIVQLSQLTKEHMQKVIKDGSLFTRGAIFSIIIMTIEVLARYIPDDFPGKLVHRDGKTMKVYLETLVEGLEQLSSTAESHDGANNDGRSVSLQLIIDALLAIPSPIRSGDLFSRLPERIITFAHEAFQTEPKVQHIAAECFQLIVEYGNENLENLTKLAEQALEQSLDARAHAKVLDVYTGSAQTTNIAGRIAALRYLEPRLRHSSSALLLHRDLLLGADGSKLDCTLTPDDGKSASGPKLFAQILKAASNGKNLHVRRTALQSISQLVNKQPSLLNQYCVEQTMATLTKILLTYTHTAVIYMDACNVLTAIFASQRSRCQGRFHLMVTLFQALITALFQDSKSEAHIQNARALARLLDSFCNPPQSRYRGRKTSELVDERRKAQAHAGQYVQYILHFYCSQILSGTVGEGVREALMPGIWSMIEVIEVNDAEGIKSLSAAMNNSERAVLRSVYDDWKRSGKWEGL